MPVPLDHLLAGMPAAREVPATEIAALARAANRVLVVLDDDPTGTQSVHDLPVVLDWSIASLTWALRQGAPAVFVLTNTRSLDAGDAERRNRDAARAAFAAAAVAGVDIALVSRSDSTLRGHFPLEPLALAEEVEQARGIPVDGLVVVPAFGDAGRITVDSIHYAGNPIEGYTPVGETEFARDATFGYRSSDLREWIQEKSGGRYAAADVARIDLRTLRTDPEGVVAALTALTDRQPIVCDIVDEFDLRRLATALYAAQAAGSTLVFRVGPPFVRALIGQPARQPLQPADITEIRGGAMEASGGLVVVGSHVSLTTRQLEELLARDRPAQAELDVAVISGGDPQALDAHVAAVAAQVAAALTRGNVVLSTSRTLARTEDPRESLAIARSVSNAVVSVVQRVLAARAPRFVVAKGGITASDVAARGLSIERAMVRGSLLPGMVSLWEPMDGPARCIPYAVFPGNVGDPGSLAEIVRTLSAS